jgi:hypothetical protein
LLLLGDLLDFVPCFWASLRVGATPTPFAGVAHAATTEELRNLVARFEFPAIVAEAADTGLAAAGRFADGRARPQCLDARRRKRRRRRTGSQRRA